MKNIRNRINEIEPVIWAYGICILLLLISPLVGLIGRRLANAVYPLIIDLLESI